MCCGRRARTLHSTVAKASPSMSFASLPSVIVTSAMSSVSLLPLARSISTNGTSFLLHPEPLPHFIVPQPLFQDPQPRLSVMTITPTAPAAMQLSYLVEKAHVPRSTTQNLPLIAAALVSLGNTKAGENLGAGAEGGRRGSGQEARGLEGRQGDSLRAAG